MKKYMLILVSIFIILVLAACGTNTDNTEQNNDSPMDENIESNENSNIEDPANDEEIVDNDENESNNENENYDLITETGIYTGQADPHTIEIETANGPLAFQLTMEARDDIEALVEGEEVTYEYTEDGDTRTIESIKMSE